MLNKKIIEIISKGEGITVEFKKAENELPRITSYNVCYTKLLRRVFIC